MKFALSALFSLALGMGAFGAVAHAEEGELHVTTKNAEYVKVQVNGVETDNTEFEKNGKVVIIKGLDTSLDHNAVTLVPTAESGLKPLDLEVVAKDFKKQHKGRFYFLVATKSVQFEKAPVPAPGDPKPGDPKPKEPDVAPPPPDKDNL
ncbi:MAG: hypothetical protein U1F43_25465 [Myxococcota bacterium]